MSSALPDKPAPLVDAARGVGVRDPRVLAAFRTVARKEFVPSVHSHLADTDKPIAIAHGQVTTQPSLVALMLEALELTGDERILEVGTGLGYQTAILAMLSEHVYTIERFYDLAERARENLERAGIPNATVVVGDGTLGLPENAPYDAIVIAAAAPTVSTALAEQLREGGRLVQPIGRGGDELVISFRKREGRLLKESSIIAACFVPLVSGPAAQ